ncbi:MAG: tetratricopeptide repeat protein [Flavipsychrobacter sp.]|nr:tetratricopeptide repeat protein [Flavipsychrobacter sp.]
MCRSYLFQKLFTRFASVCILLLFSGVSAFGQGSSVIRSRADTEGLSQMMVQAKNVGPDTALRLYKQILQRSKEANYPEGAGTALIEIGQLYIDKGKFQDGLNYFKQAYHWCLRSSNKEDIASCYNAIGQAYFYLGSYVEATNNYYIALDELKKANKTVSLTGVNVYSNLAIINLRLKQNAQALTYFNEAEDHARVGNYDDKLAMVLINKGEFYLGQKKTDSARTSFEEGLKIAKQIGKVDLQAYANEEIGETWVQAAKYEKALRYLHLAINLSKDKYNYVAIDASYVLAEALYNLGDFKQAEELLLTNLQAAASSNLKDNTIKGYTILADVYKAAGDYKKAIDCMDIISVLKDTLTSLENTKAINQMEIRYKSAEKDKLNAQNKIRIVQQQSLIAQKNMWIALIAGSIFLLVAILFGIYRNGRHKQRLQEEQIKSLQQENRIGILKAIVHGEDSERQRIARELHDGIGGMLSATMMRFMSIRHESREITKLPAYYEVMELLEEMGDEIRKTAHNLMPEVLMKQSLPDALQSFCNYMQEGGTLVIDFQCYGSFENISQDFKLNIYRILQELIKNILQHAKATTALVQLQLHDQLLTITVEDNGIGFDADTIVNGLGLHNLQTRVRSLDGNYTFDSEPGKGTSVYMEFDLRNITINEPV